MFQVSGVRIRCSQLNTLFLFRDFACPVGWYYRTYRGSFGFRGDRIFLVKVCPG